MFFNFRFIRKLQRESFILDAIADEVFAREERP